MTPAETKALRFLERYQAEHDGASPSLAEIAARLDMAAKSGAHRLLVALEEQGRIRRLGKRAVEIVGLPALLITLSDDALLAEVARRGLLQAYDGWSA